VKVFLWHRFIRLYPVHVTVLAGLVILISIVRANHIPLNNPQEWRYVDLPWQLTLLHAWGVTPKPGWNAPSWSISAEWFAYLLFPLLAPALTLVRDRVTALFVATAALAGTAWAFALADWSLNIWVGPPALVRVSGEFLCGAALCRAVALSSKPASLRGDVLGAVAFILFLAGACFAVGDFGLVALLALTIFGAATANGFLAGMLGSRSFVWLGEISYSIYMVHFPVLLVLRRFWERAGIAEWSASSRAAAFLATVGLVIALAAMLFYAVERPARTRLRDRMGKLAPA
jgi:peptidoglycan/LPS O-acetylase OafA/YrhL